MEAWQKNLLLIWICQFLTMAGMSAVVPFLPLFIRELGVTNIDKTAQWSGLVFSGPFLISIFLTPVWGQLGDRHGRKMMTIRAIFGLALAQLLIGFVQNVEQLFLCRLLQGALSGFLPSAMALVVSNTPKSKTGYALGLLQSATAAGNVLGPFLGGFIADFLGYRWVFFLVSGLLVITGIFFIFFVKETNKVSEESNLYGLKENLKYLLSDLQLRNLAILIAFGALGLAFIRPIFVLYFESFSINTEYFASYTGAVYGIVGVFTTISATWWGKRSESKGLRNSLILATLFTGVSYAVHTFIYDTIILILVRAVLGFAYGGIMPLLFTSISNKISFERKGGILGVATSFQILGNIIGPLCSGYISALIGFRLPFILAGVIFFFMAWMIQFALKETN